jgi:hypothetical protein
VCLLLAALPRAPSRAARLFLTRVRIHRARALAVDFKPASVDASRPGALELGGARGAGAARAEFAPRDPGRPPVVFEGAHVPSRDACEGVLVFENGVVRLETLAGACCAACCVRACVREAGG